MMDNYLIGKMITAVHLAEDRRAIKFEFEEGSPIIARCDGDCCSYTWIEEIEGPEQLIGSRVRDVKDIEIPKDVPSNYWSNTDVVRYYSLKISTDKGDTILDYRNNSNGYYGGSLSWGDEYYYGGVFGQNESKMVWNKIAPMREDNAA